MHDWTLSGAVNQLRQLDSSVGIIVAHPQFKSHQRLIQCFAEVHPSVYLKLDTTLETIDDLESALEAAYAAYELTKAQQARASLILDGGDVVGAPLLTEFFQKHLQKKQRGPILYSARQYPGFIESYADLRLATRLWPTDTRSLLHDYLKRDTNRRFLEVFALGSGRAFVDGKEISDWEGSLPRRLFFYLVDRGMVTRSQIFDTIWPGLPIREATNVFHVTKRKVNEVLGFDLTIYWGGFYRLSPEIDLVYDVAAFMGNLQASAVAEAEPALALLNPSLGMYRGDFLSGMDLEWAKARRAELRILHSEALAAAAHLHDQQQQPDLAIGRYSRAYAFNPVRSETARKLIQVYSASERKTDANTVRDILKLNEQTGKD
jgi:DNA-binding SARP family transcriptional activator